MKSVAKNANRMINTMDNIKLIAWNPLGRSDQTLIKEIHINNSTTLADIFEYVDSAMDVYYLPQYYNYYRWENYKNACPFVCSKSTVYWNVPYNEVKVHDFIETHNIDDYTIVIGYNISERIGSNEK